MSYTRTLALLLCIAIGCGKSAPISTPVSSDEDCPPVEMVIGEKESVTITWRVDKPQLIALASELLIPTEERRDNFAKILSDGGEVTLILTSTVASGKK